MLDNLIYNFSSIKKGYELYKDSFEDFINYEEYDYILANEYNFIEAYNKNEVNIELLNYFFNF